ncbi:CheR family methyltransferase [Anaeromyxobacter terrae]|uniref:CheR family methyltransferase n=1 Tax=Anaeromyxobacter terrae TaxID=2925406 RepID=UPI001F57C190|nr:CheR family methyltransferase [Anaeromyxobacter sp. SG22]
MTAAGREQLERFRRAVGARLGLRFDDDKLEQLAQVAEERAEATKARSIDAYVARLSGEGGGDEVRALAERLTVGETYFFRNSNDLEAFSGAVLPDRVRRRGADRRLRILSAGCASGEEPYTLAMLVRADAQLASWDVRVHGIDVNPAAIARAREGRYSAWSLRQTTPALRARFFRAEGRHSRVVDDVRALVSFEERNLVDDDPALWAPGSWDVVFCRNVVMYFSPEVFRRVVARIAGALVPGGYLFLGHAETLRGVSTDYHLRQSHGTFYYQPRGTEEGAPALGPPDDTLPSPSPSPSPWPSPTPAPAPDARTAWVQAIQEASERVAKVAAAARAPEPREGTAAKDALPTRGEPDAHGDGARVALALELLRRERFAEALAALGPRAPAAEEDVDALLLRAVLLTSSADLAGAERVCARILERDELNAEAHYLRALCREHAGDPVGAADHDRYALYLDPTFAMPRLHLGLLAKRGGDLELARRELARARVLLAGEDGSRILLLGGGFTREGLLEVCRAELGACGGME